MSITSVSIGVCPGVFKEMKYAELSVDSMLFRESPGLFKREAEKEKSSQVIPNGALSRSCGVKCKKPTMCMTGSESVGGWVCSCMKHSL